MKKILAGLLAATMAVTALAGCSGGSDKKESTAESKSEQSSKEESAEPAANGAGGFEGRDDIAYVMIYNPSVYDENLKVNDTTGTGDMMWVDPSMKRADGLEEPAAPDSPEQNFAFDFKYDLSGDRAGFMPPTYKTGDTHDFYYGLNSRVKGTFVCQAEGTHCYVWTLKNDTVDKATLQKVADEFDNTIYDADVNRFGTPRYADEGGKINFLFYDFNSESVRGFFAPKDLFSSREVTQAEADVYSVNLDHALLHINTSILSDGTDRALYATLAHEFQHLINFTGYFETVQGAAMGTWLNESMSAYAEEKLYPGVKIEKQVDLSLSYSDLVRNGQSLYNFGVSDNPFDIGVYGSVFYYAMYLENLAGEDVCHNIQNYWRTSYSPTLDTAEALYKSVPADVVSSIDGKYNYPATLSFATEDQKWMSKLTLDFYMSMLKYDSGDPDAFNYVQAQTLLYDQVNPAQIEGGGRVIAATKDGKFTIPTDAGKPLVYIGFDKDFNPVTDIVCQ